MESTIIAPHNRALPLHGFADEMKPFQLWKTEGGQNDVYVYLGDRPILNVFSGIDEETVAVESSMFGKSVNEALDVKAVSSSQTHFWVLDSVHFILVKDDWRIA
jgi:hypothetical protein